MNTRIGRNTLLNMMGQGIPLFVALIAIPPAIQYLGDARFGILSTVLIIIGTSSMFDLGMGRATTKFVSEAYGRGQHQDIPPIVSCATCIQLVLGVVVGAGIVAFSGAIVVDVFTIPDELIDESKGALILVGISVPITMVTNSYRGVLEAIHRFGAVNILRIIFSTLTYLTPLIGVIFEWGMAGITALLVGFRFIQLVVTYKVCILSVPTIKWTPLLERSRCKSMFSFGGWVTVTNFLSPLQENMERLMLAGLLPITSVTYYSVPKDILDRIYFLPGSLTSALFPSLSVIGLSGKDQLLKLTLSSIKAITMCTGLILFSIIVMANTLISIWISKEFADISALTLQILAFGAMASSLNILAMTLFQSIGRPDITAKHQLVRFPIIGGAAWLLISNYGLVGAAIAWTFGRVLALAMNLWAMSSVMKVRVQEIVSWEIAMSLIAFPIMTFACVWFVAAYGVDSIIIIMLLLVVGSTLYSLLFWAYIFSVDERRWVLGVVDKYRFNKA